MIQKNFIFIIFLIIVLTVGITGCSNRPSISDVQAVLEKECKEFPDVNLEFKNIKKINGRTSNKDGIETYTIQYEANFSYLKDEQNFMFGNHKKGENFHQSSEMNFIKTDKGWQGQNIVFNK